VSFRKSRVKERIRYYFLDQLIPELSTIEYFLIIMRNNLTWADYVNYTLRKAWKAFHFIMRTFKWEITIENV